MLETSGPRELSEQIIQGITSPEIVDVVGIGSGIPGVIAAVNLARNIARVNIKSVTLDNISIPIYGNQEAIFFELSREPEVEIESIKNFDSKSEMEKAQLTISVHKGDRIATITNQLLFKLSRNTEVKIIASGFTIVTAVRAILQVATSGISREPISISGVVATSISRRDNPSKKIAALQVYLESGHETVYPSRHSEVLQQLIKR